MRQDGDRIAAEHLRQGAPTNSTFAESMSRLAAAGDVAALTTEVMTSVAVPVQAGDVINTITFVSGSQAAVTPANWWFALYDADLDKAGQSADQETAAWAADTAKSLALTSEVLVTKAGLWYAAIMVKAGTVPNLCGVTLPNAVLPGALGLGAAVLAQTSGASLTDTAPAAIATPTTIAAVPYCALT